MFDEIIYKVLDKITYACDTLKECIKNRKLPEACYRQEAKDKEVKKWASDREKKHK